MTGGDQIQVLALEAGPSLPIIADEGAAHAVVWPGMGAQLRSLHRIDLGHGGRTIELRHPAEAVYYVMEGEGEAVDLDADQKQALRKGAMFHIDPETTYVLRASAAGMSLVGGPSPADPALYRSLS
jgi:quercetin dioxygenase-like cupin family protein